MNFWNKKKAQRKMALIFTSSLETLLRHLPCNMKVFNQTYVCLEIGQAKWFIFFTRINSVWKITRLAKYTMCVYTA